MMSMTIKLLMMRPPVAQRVARGSRPLLSSLWCSAPAAAPAAAPNRRWSALPLRASRGGGLLRESSSSSSSSPGAERWRLYLVTDDAFVSAAPDGDLPARVAAAIDGGVTYDVFVFRVFSFCAGRAAPSL